MQEITDHALDVLRTLFDPVMDRLTDLQDLLIARKSLGQSRTIKCAIIFNADLPHRNDVPCGLDVLGWISADKKQIRPEARRNASAII